jgi:hypothetical protein
MRIASLSALVVLAIAPMAALIAQGANNNADHQEMMAKLHIT